jgi:hypothetical protein
MTYDELEAIRARHYEGPYVDDDMALSGSFCEGCGQRWPCDASDLRAEVDRLRALQGALDQWWGEASAKAAAQEALNERARILAAVEGMHMSREDWDYNEAWNDCLKAVGAAIKGEATPLGYVCWKCGKEIPFDDEVWIDPKTTKATMTGEPYHVACAPPELDCICPDGHALDGGECEPLTSAELGDVHITVTNEEAEAFLEAVGAYGKDHTYTCDEHREHPGLGGCTPDNPCYPMPEA